MIHPWPRVGLGALRVLPRLWYQVAVALPVLGPAMLERRPGFVRLLLLAGSKRREAFSEADLALFSETLRQPERARASSALYRTFLSGELGRLALGGYRGLRLKTPTLLLFGTEDRAIPTAALEGYEAHADDMRVELVPGVGHFIAEEAPEVVLDRGLPFLAGEGGGDPASGSLPGGARASAPAG
jgi:pimeloyl-ACP methyl ester carboxylesterase